MVVLRCEHCGEIIKQGDKYCVKCGTEVNRPVVDQVDTYFEDVGKIFAGIFKLIILWFIIALGLGFISNILNIPVGYAFCSSFILAILVYILLR